MILPRFGSKGFSLVLLNLVHPEPSFEGHVGIMWQYPSVEMETYIQSWFCLHASKHCSCVCPEPPRAHLIFPSNLHSAQSVHSFSKLTAIFEKPIKQFMNFSHNFHNSDRMIISKKYKEFYFQSSHSSSSRCQSFYHCQYQL